MDPTSSPDSSIPPSNPAIINHTQSSPTSSPDSHAPASEQGLKQIEFTVNPSQLPVGLMEKYALQLLSAQSETDCSSSPVPGAKVDLLKKSAGESDKPVPSSLPGPSSLCLPPGSSLFCNEPDETCLSIDSFINVSDLTRSGSETSLTIKAPSSSLPCSTTASGIRNKNQSSLEETQMSAVLPLQSNTQSSEEYHVQSDTEMFTVVYAQSKAPASTVPCTHGGTQACIGHHMNSDTQPPTVSQGRMKSEVSQQDVEGSLTGCSEKEQDASALESLPEHELSEEDMEPGLEDLPIDLLLKITSYLPTVNLIALTYVHPVFTDVLTDVKFLDKQTRHVLGFLASEKDITYDIVPSPVAPLQNLWFQTYLHRAAPHMAGVVTPGVIFYNLLCFKHLLDTWILQAYGYSYYMFVSDVLKSKLPPPLHIKDCKHFTMSPFMLRMLTKVALCYPQVLLQTVNNFDNLIISEMADHLIFSKISSSNNAWDLDLPEEYKLDASPDASSHDFFEVTSCRRGRDLASFSFMFNSQTCVGWSGMLTHTMFRCRSTTWGLCKFSVNAPLSVIQKQSLSVLEQFSDYMGQEYFSTRCPEAFMIQGLHKLIQNWQKSKPVFHELQMLLEKKSAKIHRKLCKTLPLELCTEAKIFLDSVAFVEKEVDQSSAEASPQKRSSKTLEVAIQRYLHRYLNQVIGWQMVDLYKDPVCHHIVCVSCHNLYAINSAPAPACLKQVGHQRIPLKIWAPHLIQQGLITLPALARLVCLDVELWKRSLLDLPLPHKVALFVQGTLSSVSLDFHLDPGRPGVIARRIYQQK